ncbi:MAG: rane protein [Frankiales bacterium]|jgi:predicted metalloprotease|nr:rane protein [Frankiales bacterium]
MRKGYADPVDFDDNARLDTSRISDQRGRRGPGLALGGGGLGIVGVILALVLGVDPGTFTGGGTTAPQDGVESTSDVAQRCRTGADADQDEGCRIVAIENSLKTYWASAVRDFQPARTQLFTGGTSTGCGQASSAVGPFYCPPDQGIFLDLGFFEELRTTYGAKGGDFAQAYVLAHEYGHHIQNLTGQSERARQLREQTGPQGASTRLELQADCYAGTWAANAQREGFVTFDDTDVAEGLSAAAAVGDDRIQEKSAGRVDPESWTHGSAAQRQKWFTTGYKSGKPSACNTFSGTV